MKKILLFAVILLVASTMVFAGGKKEPVKPAPVPAAGEWRTFDDRDGNGGSSTARMVTKDEEIDGKTVKTYQITGNLTTQYEYGFAGWALDADPATLELLKYAEALSFYFLGDGKKYTIKFLLSNVEDYAYHEYTFETEKGEVLFIEVPMLYFSVGQAPWGTPVTWDQTLVTSIEFQTHESIRTTPRNNPYDAKFWDFMIHPGAAPKKTAAKKEAAPAQKPGVLGAFDLVLKDNFQYGDGYQGNITSSNLLNGHKLAVGDKFTIKFSYTASRDLEDVVQFGFVDTTPAAAYWRGLSWIEDKTDMLELPASKAGELVTAEVSFEILVNATAGSTAANTFTFQTKGEGKKGSAGSGVKKPVTFTFKEFTLTKN